MSTVNSTAPISTRSNALISVKVSNGTSIRRMAASPDMSFVAFLALVITDEQAKASPAPTISYTDSDGDRVLIASDDDLKEAFRLVPTNGLLRIEVSSTSATPTATPTTTTSAVVDDALLFEETAAAAAGEVDVTHFDSESEEGEEEPDVTEDDDIDIDVNDEDVMVSKLEEAEEEDEASPSLSPSSVRAGPTKMDATLMQVVERLTTENLSDVVPEKRLRAITRNKNHDVDAVVDRVRHIHKLQTSRAATKAAVPKAIERLEAEGLAGLLPERRIVQILNNNEQSVDVVVERATALKTIQDKLPAVQAAVSAAGLATTLPEEHVAKMNMRFKGDVDAVVARARVVAAQLARREAAGAAFPRVKEALAAADLEGVVEGQRLFKMVMRFEGDIPRVMHRVCHLRDAAAKAAARSPEGMALLAQKYARELEAFDAQGDLYASFRPRTQVLQIMSRNNGDVAKVSRRVEAISARQEGLTPGQKRLQLAAKHYEPELQKLREAGVDLDALPPFRPTRLLCKFDGDVEKTLEKLQGKPGKRGRSGREGGAGAGAGVVEGGHRRGRRHGHRAMHGMRRVAARVAQVAGVAL